MKSKNRNLTAQMREIEEALTQRLASKSRETDVKYVDALVKENSELKEEVHRAEVIIVVLVCN